MVYFFVLTLTDGLYRPTGWTRLYAIMRVNTLKLSNQEPSGKVSPREQHLKNFLYKEEPGFLKLAPCSIWVGTWNVQGDNLQYSLSAWLRDSKDKMSSPPDVLLLSLQEIERRPEALLIGSSSRVILWDTCMLQSLEIVFPECKYRLVGSKALVGTYAGLYMNEGLIDQCSLVTSTSISCGFMDIFGNKGAVAIKAKIGSTYLCFISCHLSPHTYNIQRRLYEFDMISNYIRFPKAHRPFESLWPQESNQYLKNWSTSLEIWDSDLVIIGGDLNFRIEGSIHEIFSNIFHNNVDALQKRDQLWMARSHKYGILSRLEEGKISFLPSYKFIPNTNTYLPEEFNKAPAYTDRILFRAGDPLIITSYQCHLEIQGSDHRPVTATFVALVRLIEKNAFLTRLRTALFALDQIENQSIAMTSLSRNSIDMGYLTFPEKMQNSVELFNKGNIPACFTTYTEAASNDTTVPRISVFPKNGLVLPHEKELIKVEMIVDKELLLSVSKREPKTFTTFIRIEVYQGHVHFIEVKGVI